MDSTLGSVHKVMSASYSGDLGPAYIMRSMLHVYSSEEADIFKANPFFFFFFNSTLWHVAGEKIAVVRITYRKSE